LEVRSAHRKEKASSSLGWILGIQSHIHVQVSLRSWAPGLPRDKSYDSTSSPGTLRLTLPLLLPVLPTCLLGIYHFSFAQPSWVCFSHFLAAGNLSRSSYSYMRARFQLDFPLRQTGSIVRVLVVYAYLYVLDFLLCPEILSSTSPSLLIPVVSPFFKVGGKLYVLIP